MNEPNQSHKRDEQLDLYRGIVMLYIVCFIHVIYWLGIGQEPLRSLALIEMPAVFFISGAALSVTHNRRRLAATLWSRAKRVVFPFYIYAAVSLIVLSLLVGLRSVLSDLSSLSDSIASTPLGRMTWHDLFTLLSCKGIPHAPYASHLWFIIPYLVLTCTFGLQQKAREYLSRGGYFSLCLIAFCLSAWAGRFTTITAYNLFFVAGWLFYRQLSWRTIYVLTLLCALVTSGILLGGATFCPMQAHKFPPDFVFVAYGFFSLCLCSIVFGHCRLPSNSLLKRWNQAGYTIYLYQNLVYAVWSMCFYHWEMFYSHRWIGGFASALAVFVGSTLLSYFTIPIERWCMQQINSLHDHFTSIGVRQRD